MHWRLTRCGEQMELIREQEILPVQAGFIGQPCSSVLHLHSY